MSAIQLDDDLIRFFNNIEMNLYDGDVTINLMDLFPLLKQGISCVNMVYRIIYLYSFGNNLLNNGNFVADKAIGKCFNIKEGDLIPFINLYRIVLEKTKPFPKFNSILVIDNENWIVNFLRELHINKERYNLKKDLFVAMKEYGFYDFLEHHPKINKLHFSIVFKDFNDIKPLLATYDPRSSNNRSYILALERQNNNIIKLVYDSIILRILLHKELLTKYIIFDDLIKDLYYTMCNFL